MKSNYDLIVIGGGLTGVAASVCAARNGLSTLLIEQSGALGGALNTSLVYPFMPFWTTEEIDGKKQKKYLSNGVFREILNELEKLDAFRHDSSFQDQYLKVVLDRFTKSAGVEVLFHSTLFKANVSENKIISVEVANKVGSQTFNAKYFVDATGDADLAAFSGCEFIIGRKADNLCQPMTLCFRVANVDDEIFCKSYKTINDLYQEFQRQGKIKNPRENILYFSDIGKGVVHFNSTRVIKLNPVNPDDLSKAEIIGREQMLELFTFLKENFACFKDSILISSSASIGVRESRMIIGEHVLSAEELKNCTKFEDSIAAGNYDIDIHNPEGSGTSHYYFKPGEYYTIPYRSLIPKQLGNLIVAGRCISATHEAQASIRIMPICCCLGEAAGAASAVAFDENTTFKNADIHKIQAKLKENKVFF